jgi:glucuronyl hydrolase (fragment)
MIDKNIEPLKAYQSNESEVLTPALVDEAIKVCLEKIDSNLERLGEQFPTPATFDNDYKAMENIEWTNGFWTGMLWLAYEFTGEEKYKVAAEKNVASFIDRIERLIEVNHHDLGFLYTPSCVSAYKVTGNEKAKEAAIKAADQLASRYQEKGNFIQAWGELGARDNYRLIVDCLLNIPLLFWASNETGDGKYQEMAKAHFQTTLKNAIRQDASAFHTFFFDPETGEPTYGKTRQGYSDDSAWARGQAWLIYGIALCNAYAPSETNVEYFQAVTNYFLNRVPEDFVCYWDLIFDDTSGQPRDTSAAAIAVCGIQQMAKEFPNNETVKEYEKWADRILYNLITKYTDKKGSTIVALLNEGVYSWHSGKGVNEGNIWGDYFYLEALMRKKKDWGMYW